MPKLLCTTKVLNKSNVSSSLHIKIKTLKNKFSSAYAYSLIEF